MGCGRRPRGTVPAAPVSSAFAPKSFAAAAQRAIASPPATPRMSPETRPRAVAKRSSTALHADV